MNTPRKILGLVLTAVFAPAIALIFVLGLPAIAIARFLDQIAGKRILIPIVYWLVARIIVLFTGSSVRVRGKENLPHAGGNIVYAVNHQGYFDIPLMLGWVDRTAIFVAREDLMRVPALGLWMKLMGCIFISRKASREELRKFESISDVLRAGARIIIFPEGTRSHNGEFGEFHTASFRPSKTAQSLIVPVLIWGSHKILPRGARIFTPTRVNIAFAEPIAYSEYGTLSPIELVARFKQSLDEMKAQMQITI